MTFIKNRAAAEKLSAYCDRVLNLRDAKLGEMHYYQSLPLCVIEAVFSINVRYESTKNTVIKYCNYFKLNRVRNKNNALPTRRRQESIAIFVKKFEKLGIEKFTEDVFDNRQRTSTTNGILKSEAVYRFARTLKSHKVNYFQDVGEVINRNDFENDIKSIPGQKSGISLSYFYMMAGADSLIKPDRHVWNFVKKGLNEDVSLHEAENLLYDSSRVLELKYPHITPRLLDNVIWNHQRSLAKRPINNRPASI